MPFYNENKKDLTPKANKHAKLLLKPILFSLIYETIKNTICQDYGLCKYQTLVLFIYNKTKRDYLTCVIILLFKITITIKCKPKVP